MEYSTVHETSNYSPSGSPSHGPIQQGMPLAKTHKLCRESVLDADTDRAKALRYVLAMVLIIPFAVSWLLRARYFPTIEGADEKLVTWGNYLGDASFAVTGAMTAGNTGMDVLGVTMIGVLTALGGGTIRDILMGNTPISWMTSYDEITVCSVCSLSVFYGWPLLVRKFRFSTEDEWLFWTDAIGVGVFAATGARTGQLHGATVYGCALCGMISATFGGLMRDVLCQRPVRILYSTCEVYAPCGLLGGLCTALMVTYGHDMVPEGILLGTWVGIFTRVMCYNHFLTLPVWRIQEVTQTEPMHNERFDAPYLGTRGNQVRVKNRNRGRSVSAQNHMISVSASMAHMSDDSSIVRTSLQSASFT